jgi:hypothetical protein
MPDLEMAQMFAELAQSLDLQDSVADALEQTVRLAWYVIETGVDPSAA